MVEPHEKGALNGVAAHDHVFDGRHDGGDAGVDDALVLVGMKLAPRVAAALGDDAKLIRLSRVLRPRSRR